MNALQALLGFATWTLLLVTGVLVYRGLRFTKGVPINSWPRGQKSLSDALFVKRLEDAHANCLENLPVFASIVLVAAALGKLELIATMAPWVFYARMGQSLAHLSGQDSPQVFVRSSFWLVQLGLMFWMMYQLLA